MNRYCVLAFGALWWVAGGAAPLSAEPTTLLAKPDEAQANVAASPKLDDRVLVYCGEAVSSSVLEHNVGRQEIALNVGAKQGVRFGHAFQIVAPDSRECVGVAKVIELQAQRCVAKVVYLDQDKVAQSLKGFSAVCTAPKSNRTGIVIQCAFGKDIWRTESFENKLIRSLLESGGAKVQILIREDSPDQARGE